MTPEVPPRASSTGPLQAKGTTLQGSSLKSAGVPVYWCTAQGTLNGRNPLRGHSTPKGSGSHWRTLIHKVILV